MFDVDYLLALSNRRCRHHERNKLCRITSAMRLEQRQKANRARSLRRGRPFTSPRDGESGAVPAEEAPVCLLDTHRHGDGQTGRSVQGDRFFRLGRQ